MNHGVCRVALAVLMSLSLAVLSGCADKNPRTAPVKGKITLNGQPVPRGTVQFVPEIPGTTATGELNPDGTYRLSTFRPGDGAVLGKHKVAVIALGQAAPGAGLDGMLPQPIVPLKYTSFATTDVTADVQEGENTLDFDLKGSVPKDRKVPAEKTGRKKTEN